MQDIEKMTRESLGVMLDFYISNVGYCFVRNELWFIIFWAFLVDMSVFWLSNKTLSERPLGCRSIKYNNGQRHLFWQLLIDHNMGVHYQVQRR